MWAVRAASQPAVELTEGKVSKMTIRPPRRMIVGLKKKERKFELNRFYLSVVYVALKF